MKQSTPFILVYLFLFLPFLLLSQLQTPYVFYKKNGDTLNVRQLRVVVSPKQQVTAFNLEGKFLDIEKISAFSEGDNYYHLDGYDKKGGLNLFKRYWSGDKVELFYKNHLKVVSFPRIEMESTKYLYYRQKQGKLTPLKYENVIKDFASTTDKGVEKLLSKVKGIKRLRKLSIWLGVGSTIYAVYRLDKTREVNLTSFLPIVIFGYTSFTINKENRFLEDIVKFY